MSVRISLTLATSEMFLSLHMIFSLERAAVVWDILERISNPVPINTSQTVYLQTVSGKLSLFTQ